MPNFFTTCLVAWSHKYFEPFKKSRHILSILPEEVILLGLSEAFSSEFADGYRSSWLIGRLANTHGLFFNFFANLFVKWQVFGPLTARNSDEETNCHKRREGDHRYKVMSETRKTCWDSQILRGKVMQLWNLFQVSKDNLTEPAFEPKTCPLKRTGTRTDWIIQLCVGLHP